MLYSIIKYEEFFARLCECILWYIIIVIINYSHGFCFTSYINN